MKTIAVFGGTGLIGRKFIDLCKEKGYLVSLFTRDLQTAAISIHNADNYYKLSDSPQKMAESLNGAFAVVNLAGSPISRRWTANYKETIRESRIKTTRLICDTMKLCSTPPGILFNASAVGFYGNTGNMTITETSPSGNDFLASICRDWENEAGKVSSIARVIFGRFGIVLDQKEGALSKMLPAFKLFAGGPLGSGRQWLPWIHIEDVASMILFALENDNISGGFNIVSPEPVQMKKFASTLGKTLKRPSFFPVPPFVLILLKGEMATVVLNGTRALPEKAMNNSYQFKFTELRSALLDLVAEPREKGLSC